jgi:hypothetical protein
MYAITKTRTTTTKVSLTVVSKEAYPKPFPSSLHTAAQWSIRAFIDASIRINSLIQMDPRSKQHHTTPTQTNLSAFHNDSTRATHDPRLL